MLKRKMFSKAVSIILSLALLCTCFSGLVMADEMDLVLADEEQLVEEVNASEELAEVEEELPILEEDTEAIASSDFSEEESVNELEAEVETQENPANALKATSTFLAGQDAPTVGNEWVVLGLARGDYAVSENYFKDYYTKVVAYMQEKGTNKISGNKSSDNSRTIIGLASIGAKADNVGGYNLLEPLSDFTYLKKQGMNGPLWALIAFDSGNYTIPTVAEGGTQVTRDGLIEYLLGLQLSDGGWAMSGKVSDPDITGMVIDALAPYYSSNTEVKTKVDQAVECLAKLQEADGGYASWGTVNSESTCQVIVGLTSVGIDPSTDTRFIKNGKTMVDALMSFYAGEGQFKHVSDGNFNQMATEQAHYALVALDRFQNKKTSLYDMSDLTLTDWSKAPAVTKVSFNLTNLTTSSGTTVTDGQAYTAILKANENYKLPETIEITMGSSGLTAGTDYAYSSSSGQITITEVNGDLVISAAGVLNSQAAEEHALKDLSASLIKDATEDQYLSCTKTGEREYTVVVPDSEKLYTLYLKPEFTSEGDTGVVSFSSTAGPKNFNLTNNKFAALSSIAIAANSSCIGMQLFVNSADQTVSTEYSLLVIRSLSLQNLEIADCTMKPTFSRSVRDYSVIVPYEAKTVAITPTLPQLYKLTINDDVFINNDDNDNYKVEWAKNGTAYYLTPIWDENGLMTVKIGLNSTNSNYYYNADIPLSGEYTITLQREKRENTPDIYYQPQAVECYDTDTRTLSLKASANGTLTYQWYKNDLDSTEDGVAIDGAIEATLEMSDLVTANQTAYYYCVVTNTNEKGSYNATSSTAKVTVKVSGIPTLILTDSSDNPIPEGGYSYALGTEAADVTALKVNATSRLEGGEYTYKWYRNTTDDTGGSTAPNPGRTKADYTPKTTMDSLYYYNCQVTYTVDKVKFVAYSSTVPVKVIASSATKPTINTQPISADYAIGSAKISTLMVEVQYPTDGSVMEYQWQSSSQPDSGFSSIANATSQYYTPTSEAEVKTIYYRCLVKNVMYSVSGDIYAMGAYSDVATVRFLTVSEMTGLEGNGTESSPLLIKSAEDLIKLKDLVNNKQMTFSDTYFQMSNDITLPEDWSPIGTNSSKCFSGSLDGGNHLLTIPEGGLPLFSYVEGATVSNLAIYGTKIAGYGLVNNYTGTITIDNVTLKSGTQTLQSGLIGGTASGIETIIIRNCTAEAGVIIGYDKNQSRIGSFAGGFNGIIENCVSHATVYGVDNVGGIVGIKAQSMGSYLMRNCVFTGTVEASGNYAGGIAGSGYLANSAPNTPAVSIQNCLVSGTINGANYVGGMLGAEPYLVQCWDNGIGRIQNNLFTGTVTAGAENAYIGGIVGYMHSLNIYTMITNNYYQENCGATKGLGYVKIVDTDNKKVDISDGSVIYIDTSHTLYGTPDGTAYANHNRSDDPLGVDIDKLTKVATASELEDGTITQLLNEGENSYKNWIQSDSSPALSSDPVALELTLSGNYKTEYVIGDNFSSENMVITAKFSDGSSKELTIDEVKIEGFDSTERGAKTVIIKYGAASAEFSVRVLLPETTKNITVYFTLLGDSIHNSIAGEHTMHANNLQTWIAKKAFTVSQNATVRQVFELALTEAGMTWSNPTGNYVESITKDKMELAELSNGSLSGWMYLLDGKHSQLGVDEQYLNDGQSIIFHYTDNYTVETDEIISENVYSPEININNGQAKATVADLGKDITGIDYVLDLTSSGQEVKTVQLGLNQKALGQLAGATSTLIKTDLAQVELDQASLGKLTSSGDLTLNIEQKTNAQYPDALAYEINIADSQGNKLLTDGNNGITLRIPYAGEDYANKEIYLFDAEGRLIKQNAVYENGYFVVALEHLSEYLLMNAQGVDNGFTVSAVSATPEVNGTEEFAVDLVVSSSKANNFASLQTSLNYDPALVSYVRTEALVPEAGRKFLAEANSSGKVNLTLAGEALALSSGQLAVARVIFAPVAADNTAASFSLDAKTLVGTTAQVADSKAAATTPLTVNLHNLVVSFAGNDTETTLAQVDAYAKYNQAGLYTDNSYSTAFAEPIVAVAKGYLLKTNAQGQQLWNDGTNEYSFAEIMTKGFTANASFTPAFEVQSVSGTINFIADTGSESLNYLAAPAGYHLLVFTPDSSGHNYTYDGKAMFKAINMYNGKAEAEVFLYFVPVGVNTAEIALAKMDSSDTVTCTTITYNKDLNLSGGLNIIDAQIAYDLYTELSDFETDFNFSLLGMRNRLEADVNKDGSVNTTDAWSVQRFVMEQMKK